MQHIKNLLHLGSKKLEDEAVRQEQEDAIREIWGSSIKKAEECVTALLELDNRKPLPSDQIRLPDGSITTREALIAQGVAFVNAIGNGEKKILDGENCGKQFLTREEINAVMGQQKKVLAERGITETEISEVASDMRKFLCELSALEISFAGMRRDEPLYYHGRFEIHRNPLSSRNAAPAFFHRLNGFSCPFLDCGYHFKINPDFTLVELNDELGYAPRFNEVVAHLATHGLSETGSSVNGSWDQQYITIPEYYKAVFLRKGPQ